MKIHTGERNRRFKCELCNDSFLKNSHLIRHKQTKSHQKRELVQEGVLLDAEDRNKPFGCELCNVSFVKNSHLARHNNSKKHQKEVMKRGSAFNIKLEQE